MTLALLLAAALAPLGDDRPPAADLVRFPPLEVCKEALAANVAHWHYLQARQGLELQNYWALRAWEEESNALWYAWQELKNARCWQRPDDVRTSLARLRELIGPELYYAGTMPACVPYWRFTPRD